MGPATWLSLQPPAPTPTPTPTPTGIPGILLSPASSLSPLTLPGSRDRSRLTTSRCRHSHEAVRGRGRRDKGEAAVMALKLNWETRLPELSSFALPLFQITKVSDSLVSYSLPRFPPTISNSFLESRCLATRQVQGIGALRFHEGPRIWVFGEA